MYLNDKYGFLVLFSITLFHCEVECDKEYFIKQIIFIWSNWCLRIFKWEVTYLY